MIQGSFMPGIERRATSKVYIDKDCDTVFIYMPRTLVIFSHTESAYLVMDETKNCGMLWEMNCRSVQSHGMEFKQHF